MSHPGQREQSASCCPGARPNLGYGKLDITIERGWQSMTIQRALLAAALGLALACSRQANTGNQAGSGGHSDGGANGTGGGRANGTGGSSATGGSQSGGAAAPGGSGGAGGFAGTSATGGAASTGSGGATASGGTTSSGGAMASGGAGAAAGETGSGGTAAGGAGGGARLQPLGMNDVTILAPLPQAGAEPVLLNGTDLAEDGTPFIPRDLFDRLANDSVTGTPLPTLDTSYARLQLVAVRFDLCDRHLPVPCSDSQDALLRLVFQPISTQGTAADIGFHAFYAVHADEVAAALRALRELAALTIPVDGVLRVSEALAGPNRGAYATKLRELVKHYGGGARLLRLTMNAQNLNASALVWLLRGIEKKGDVFVDIAVAGSTSSFQTVTLLGAPSYPGFSATPSADTPVGLAGAISQTKFDAADVPAKRQFMAALAAVDNPLTNTAETVPCVACHVATVVMNSRASTTAIDPLTLPGRYSSTFELSVAGGNSATVATTLRALGYLGTMPLISQRVVNETAQVLVELAQRFPGP
jgi:hypothetical protein